MLKGQAGLSKVRAPSFASSRRVSTSELDGVCPFPVGQLTPQRTIYLPDLHRPFSRPCRQKSGRVRISSQGCSLLWPRVLMVRWGVLIGSVPVGEGEM